MSIFLLLFNCMMFRVNVHMYLLVHACEGPWLILGLFFNGSSIVFFEEGSLRQTRAHQFR